MLVLMDQIDQANKVWKDKEASAKSIESGLQARIKISAWEAKAEEKTLEAAAGAKSWRSAKWLVAALPAIRCANRMSVCAQNKRTNAVVPIRNGQCTGCHMRVSPNLINEIQRGQKLMTCESCARIVYTEEAPAPAAETSK